MNYADKFLHGAFKIIQKKLGADYVRGMYTYIFKKAVIDDMLEVERIFSILEGDDEIMFTIEECLKKHGNEIAYNVGVKKGIRQGVEQGIERGLEQVARKLLEKHNSIDSVVEITGISIPKAKELERGLFGSTLQ